MRQCDECKYYGGGEVCNHPSIGEVEMCGKGDTFPWIDETPTWCPIDKDEQSGKESHLYGKSADSVIIDESQTDCAWK